MPEPAAPAVPPDVTPDPAAGGGAAGAYNPHLPDPSTVPAGDFRTTLPKEYVDKPYLKDIDSMDKLLKSFDNAQALIGKRPAGIPQENAPQEEWDKFFGTLGRPEKAEGYELAPNKELADVLGWDEKFAGSVKELMHKTGLTKKQAVALAQGYDGLLLGQHKEQLAARKAEDEGFANLAKTVFGDQADKALADANALIREHAPAEVAKYLDKLPNESLAVLAGVLTSIRKKYISEDAAPPAGGAGGGSGMSEDAVRTEGRRLMALPAYSDFRHPDHQKTVEAVQKLYKTA